MAQRHEPVPSAEAAKPRGILKNSADRGEQAPPVPVVEDAILDPAPLGVGQEGAIRGVEVLVIVGLAVAAGEPGVEDHELGQVAEGDRSPEAAVVVGCRCALVVVNIFANIAAECDSHRDRYCTVSALAECI